MKALAATALVALASLPAVASDARPASEAEMFELLQGCWLDASYSGGAPQYLAVCFEADGSLSTPSFTCSLDHGCQAARGRGTYRLADGKLTLNTVDLEQSWLIYENAACDVLVRPDDAFILSNCVSPKYVRDVDRKFSRTDLIEAMP
ncbi:MAG: hypothetical protein ACO1OG_00030 [Devosia sp.]